MGLPDITGIIATFDLKVEAISKMTSPLAIIPRDWYLTFTFTVPQFYRNPINISGSKHLRYVSKTFVLVKILYQNPHTNTDSDNFYISIPKDWSGGADDEVTVIIDDVCVIVPQTIAGATGELIVLRLLEAMIEGDIIDAGDIQKAIEHIL